MKFLWFHRDNACIQVIYSSMRTIDAGHMVIAFRVKPVPDNRREDLDGGNTILVPVESPVEAERGERMWVKGC